VLVEQAVLLRRSRDLGDRDRGGPSSTAGCLGPPRPPARYGETQRDPLSLGISTKGLLPAAGKLLLDQVHGCVPLT